MKGVFRCWLILLALLPVLANAAEWRLGDLYLDAELKYWQGRYLKNIQWNFDTLILGKLTPNERQRLGHVQLDFPLRAAGELRDHPLQFYAAGKVITVPILSIRFLDDITQAWGYLWSNGHDLKLVADYLAMIKYRNPADFPGGRFPPPLAALGIPKDAWKHDKKMDDVSQKALKSAIVWVLAHELAHIYYRHPGYGPGVTRKEAQQNESEADQFANMIMRRIGVAPVGMVQYFMSLAYLDAGRGDFSTDSAWQNYLQTKSTHPLTAKRLESIAQDLLQSPNDFTSEAIDQQAAVRQIQFIAGQISGIGTILADEQLHRLVVGIGLASDLQSLRNRQRISATVAPGKLCNQIGNPISFQGDYTGFYVRYLKDGTKEWLKGSIQLRRSQNRVAGRFTFGAGEGILEGNLIRGKQLAYEWRWGNATGKGMLVLSQFGGLTGNWGYDSADKGGGSWELCLTRFE